MLIGLLLVVMTADVVKKCSLLEGKNGVDIVLSIKYILFCFCYIIYIHLAKSLAYFNSIGPLLQILQKICKQINDY